MNARCSSICYEIKQRLFTMRSLTAIIMMFFLFHIWVKPVCSLADSFEGNMTVAMLFFVQNDPIFSKTILLCVLYFYSNVPFADANQMYVIARTGKKRWGIHNFIYLGCSAAILSVCMVVLQWLVLGKSAVWSNTWTVLCKNMAVTELSQQTSIPISYALMKSFTPYAALLYTILIDWMVFFLLGQVLYLGSIKGKNLLAYLIDVVLIFLPSVLMKMETKLVFLSPISWFQSYNWRIQYDSYRPDLPYIIMALMLLIVALGMLGQKWMEKYEIIVREEG